MKSTLTANGKEIISWCWINEEEYENSGFECCKCTEKGENKTQPTYCRCEELPKGHFHFKCATCGFDAIMRTFDDTVDLESKDDEDNTEDNEE